MAWAFPSLPTSEPAASALARVAHARRARLADRRRGRPPRPRRPGPLPGRTQRTWAMNQTRSRHRLPRLVVAGVL